MSPFRPRKSAEELGLRIQTEMEQVNGLDTGYPIPKLCSHKAVINYSRGEFDCLAKHFPEQTPSVWHFLSWSAYSNCTSAGVARRQCPLTKCNYTVIDDPDKLRAHVFSCAFLSDGRYWCDHCNREEKFTPFQCKECPVYPYRRNRLSQKAKKMFRWLGTRSHQKGVSCSALAAVDKGKPAGTALPELGNSFNAVEIGVYDEPSAELDSSNSIHPLMRPNDPTPVSQPSSMLFNNHCISGARSRKTQPLEEQDSHSPAGRKSTSEPHSMNGLPRLQSPISPLSPGWTPEHHINTISTSPTETVCSDESLLSKLSSDTSVSSVSTQRSSEMHITPSSLSHGRLTKAATAKNLNIVNTSLPHEDRARRPRSVEESERSCQHPDVLAAFLCAKDCAPLNGPSNALWLGPLDIVQDFWTVIEQHVEVSMEKLRQLASSVVVRDLLHMTTEVITARGLETWKQILSGYLPTNVADFISLLHVTFACAMVIQDCHMTSRLQQLFSHALLLEAGALSFEDKALYFNIVKILWQPPVEPTIKHGRFLANGDQNAIHLPSRKSLDCSLQGEHANGESATAISRMPRESGNDVFGVLDDFLILLEGAALSSRLSVADAPLQSITRDADFTLKVMQSIIYPLMPRSMNSEPSLEAFISEIRKMETLVQMGRLSSIREVEVGLVWAARRVIRSLSLYEEIIGRVKELCVLFSATDYISRNERSICGIEQFRRHLNDVQPKIKVSYSNKTKKRRASIPSRISSQHPDVLDTSASNGMENLSIHEATARQVTEAHMSNSSTTKRKKISASDVGDSSSVSSYLIGISPQAADSEQANICCQICGHRPTGDPKWYRGNLAKHMRTHDNNKFSCHHLGCGKSYGRPDNLSQHIKEHHSGNKRRGDSWSRLQFTKSFGNHLEPSREEDASVSDSNYYDQNPQTSPTSKNMPLQIYHVSPGDGWLWG